MRIEGRAPHALHTQRSVWVALRRSSRYRDPTRFGGRLVHPHLPEGLAGTNARHQDEERREGDRLASFGGEPPTGDRKSTRLNSSHGYISYAVFCLKKKKSSIEQETSSRLS